MKKEGEHHLTSLLQRSEEALGPAHEQTKGLLESFIYLRWDQDRSLNVMPSFEGFCKL